MKKIAYINADIYPISSPPIHEGALLVEDNKIVGVQEGSQILQDFEIVDLRGKTVLPGFVDEHTHIGIWSEWYGPPESDGNEGSNPITPEVSALDAIWPEHSAFEDARSGGVTTAQITPGSGNILGGEMVVAKTRGLTVDDMVIRNPSGLKAALGENPKNSYGSRKKAPVTRMGNAALLRGALYKAREYGKKLQAGQEDPSKLPDTDLGMQNILKVLRREIPLRIHAHRADDIVTAVRVAEELDIDYSIEHCTDGAAVAEFLGKRKAKVNIGPGLSSRSKVETRSTGNKTAGILAKAGCKVSIMSDHPFLPVQFLSTAAALACANGMSEDDALRAVTLTPAETLGVSDRVGSLEAGKDADFVVWSGHPFKIRSRVLEVFIEGERVYSQE